MCSFGIFDEILVDKLSFLWGNGGYVFVVLFKVEVIDWWVVIR